MLTSKQIVELVTGHGTNRGQLVYFKRELDRAQMTRTRLDPASYRSLVNALVDGPDLPKPAAPYKHPGPGVVPKRTGTNTGLGLEAARQRFGDQAMDTWNQRAGANSTSGVITASDIEWLRRLPTDPSAISFEDAQILADLANRAAPGSGDARLIEQIWGPVRQHHDRLAAEHALDAARRPWPDIPEDEALAALVDAISAETTELTEREIRGRARHLLDEAAAARDAKYEDQVAAARQRLNEVAEQVPA